MARRAAAGSIDRIMDDASAPRAGDDDSAASMCSPPESSKPDEDHNKTPSLRLLLRLHNDWGMAAPCGRNKQTRGAAWFCVLVLDVWEKERRKKQHRMTRAGQVLTDAAAPTRLPAADAL